MFSGRNTYFFKDLCYENCAKDFSITKDVVCYLDFQSLKVPGKCSFINIIKLLNFNYNFGGITNYKLVNQKNVK